MRPGTGEAEVLRGEIWELAFPKTKENSTAHPIFVLILSSDALGVLPLRIVVPLVPWLDRYASVPWMVRVPPVLHSGLDAPAAADALRMQSVSTALLTRRVGELPRAIVDRVGEAVKRVIEAG